MGDERASTRPERPFGDAEGARCAELANEMASALGVPTGQDAAKVLEAVERAAKPLAQARPEAGSFADAVAVGEFPVDSFPVRKRQPGDTAVLEGYLYMLENTRPYQIPYRIMIPEKLGGLIVPVAASTSHVAYSSIRTEPTWMALGQAAGVAAHLALEQDLQPRQVPVGRLQEILRRQGQVLDLEFS